MSLPEYDDTSPAHRLSPPDGEALDALVDAGFDLSRVPEHVRPRALRAAALLGLLGSAGIRASDSLVDRTMSALDANGSGVEATLSRDDALALEALANCGFDASGVPERHRAKAALHARLASIAADTPAPGLDSPDLAQRTFDLVMVAADRPVILPFPTADLRPRIRRMNYFDAVGVAAMLLLGVSVIWPVFSAVQHRQAKSGCMANLGAVASAMSKYAGDNLDSLPVVTASLSGTSWWEVGQPGRSNSANLLALARKGYTEVERLACPAHARGANACPTPDEQDWRNIRDVSYSYQVMFGTARPKWNGPKRVAVLADRSPIVLRNQLGEPAYPRENSPNHAQQGQEVLFSDGSALWTTTPELSSGDNIWLPRGVEELIRKLEGRESLRLQGIETPGSELDAFLGP